MRKNTADQQNYHKPKKELRSVRSLLACLQDGSAPAWLAGEHYLLCGMCRAVMNALVHSPALPYVSNTKKQSVPYAFTVSETVVPRANTVEMITALSHFHPDEAFLRSFPMMRTAAVLCRIAQHRTNTDAPREFGAWLDQLRYGKEIDWDAVHDALSSVEQTFMRDPGGAYPLCDRDTKAAYRTALCRYAEKKGIAEEEAAAEVLARAEHADTEAERQISFHLFPRVDGRRGVNLHMLFYAISAILAVGTGACFGGQHIGMALAIGCVSLLPYYALVRECANGIASRFFAGRAAPVLRYDVKPGEIPEEGRVLTVITALMRGGEHDRALIRNLERFYLRSRGGNVSFGLLCDLTPSDDEECDKDCTMIAAAQEQISQLNRRYGAHFCLFVRRRIYSEGENCYMGWERKRGAVLMLCRLLRGVGRESFLCADTPDETAKQIRYVCTLDEDTVLPPDALCRMVGAMLHPHNRPVIRAGAVVSGCAILQPAMAVTLEGASASHFTLLCTGRGGMDPYSRYHSDGESVLYGEGSFCGKGMFDVDAFLAVLDGAFPEHAVLSHDFLEGVRLGCRDFPAVTFSDTIPTTPTSYFSRQSRWVRGDVQALRFAFSSHKNEAGEPTENPVPVSARLRIIDHALSALTPPAILRAVLLISFLSLPHGMTFLLLCLLFSPYLYRPIGLCLRPWAWHTFRRMFFGVVYTDLRQALYWLGFRILFAAQEGWVNTKAIVTALYRMLISKRNLLAWVTAGESEKKRGQTTVAVVYRSMQVSVFLGGALVLFSPHPSAKVLGLLWCCAPWLTIRLSKAPQTRYAHRFSADFAKKKPEGMLTLEECRAQAEPIWRFFADHVSEDTQYLPPDNVQWFPITEKKIAARTSPTNIGLYLCACVSACAFGFIDEKELWNRLESTHRTLFHLRRYRGHFYNWYDLHTCDVIGTPYISTVDSGNLACALLCAAAGAEAYANNEIRLRRTAKKLRLLAEEMDFSFLYHVQSGHLHLGFDTEKERLSVSRYDLYASEIRSAVYFAIAAGQIPSSAWYALGSPLAEQDRHIGILSWTGSAFEYFMPSLWLSAPADSHSAELLAFAFESQVQDCMTMRGERSAVTVFGKSEGAYFGFDAARNFQYQAYGTPSLALCDGMEKQRLCMPYALYLMLPFSPGVVREALDGLPTLGMRGPYGLYEALDATDGRVGSGYAVVRSYMAHHQGMSLMALTNAAFDGLFQRYFFSDTRMEAYRILLCEKILTDAKPADPPHREIPAGNSFHSKEDACANTVDTTASTEDVCAVLSNAASYILADARGYMTLYHGALALTPAHWDDLSLTPTFFCYDAVRNTVYTPCRRMCETSDDAVFVFREERARLIWEAQYRDGSICRLTASVSTSGIGYRFALTLFRHGAEVPYLLTVLFRPVLYAPYAYAVHRTFADLFLRIRRDGRDSTVYLHRRPRTEEEQEIEMTLTAGGLDHFNVCGDAAHLLPLGYTVQDILALGTKDSLPARIGTRPVSAVVPLLCLRGRATGGNAVLLFQMGLETPTFDAGLLSQIRGEHRQLCSGCDLSYVSDMLFAAVHRRRTHLLSSNGRIRPVGAPHGKERLWKYGISGDLPYYCIPVGEGAVDLALMSSVLASWKYLLLCGLRTDLVVCVEETDAYGAPADRRLHEEIERQGLQFFLGAGAQSGGVHFCRRQDAEEDGLLLTAAAVFSADAAPPSVPARVPKILKLENAESPTRYALDERGIVVTKGRQAMPWSFVLSNGVFSTLLTTNTLGFTFFENARECRVTPWYGDAASERCGELLLLRFSGTDGCYDLCRAAQSSVITPVAVHYLGVLPKLSYRVSVSIPDRMRHKRMEIRLKNDGTEPITVRLRYQLCPLFGVVQEDGEAVSWNEENRTLLFRTETNAACARYTAAVSLVGCEDSAFGQAGEDMLYVGGSARIPAGEEVLLAAHLRIIRDGERSVAADALVPQQTWACPKIDSKDPGLDALAAVWLPWQIVTVRMFARCGFYQPGGAYGFRDQLQDAMAAAVFAPSLLYTQLFRAAAHQYLEGDVQHWWHPEPARDPAKFHRGIRSRCSDDRLWLPLAAARYAHLTGDHRFLQKTVRYIESPPLGEREGERYEVPLRSSVRESLYMHCVRAIECTLRVGFGVHGMPLIGIGDWNDGMNRVGNLGQGESVWGGMFLLLVLSEFLPLCAEMGDESGIRSYTSVMKQLSTAIESEAWNGQWYRRAWYDDGTPMGDPGDAEAEIDLLPQAFAALVNHRVRLPGGGKPFDEVRVHDAMLAAYERLFDEKHGVFALLDPPFGSAQDKQLPNPGYIAGYPPGARENGGQYTHAAVWGAMGLFAVGETERGMRVVHALSPLSHTKTDAGIRRYQKEPWALCGDVLRTPDRIGEGGWSLYTGSAGWYYRLLLELFGDDSERVRQNLPDSPGV